MATPNDFSSIVSGIYQNMVDNGYTGTEADLAVALSALSDENGATTKWIDLGASSAYAIAVEHGYTGTEEEWIALLMNITQNAQIAKDSADSAAESAASAKQSEEAIPTKKEEALQAIASAESGALQSVNTAGTTQTGNVNTAGQTQVQAVNAAGTTQIGLVEQEGSDQKDVVTAEGEKQTQRVSNQGILEVQAVTGEGTKQKGEIDAVGQGWVDELEGSGDDLIAEHVADLVLSQDTQPDNQFNKIWLKPSENDLVLAEMEDITKLMQKCDLIEQPASANRFNPDAVQIGLVHTNGSTYTGGTYDNYRYMDIGHVDAGSVIYGYGYYPVVQVKISRVVFFDVNGSVMSSESKADVASATVPVGADRVVISIGTSLLNSFMVLIDVDSIPDNYIPYSEATKYYVAGDGFIPSEIIANTVRAQRGLIASQNTDFFYISKNLVDPSTIVNGEFVNQINGLFQKNDTNERTGYVPIIGGKTYCIRRKNDSDAIYIRYAFYNAKKTFLTGAYVNLGEISYVLTAPTDATFIAVSTNVWIGQINEIMIAESDVKTDFESYDLAYILPKYIADVEDISINIPAKIYALVGYELNIYFENIVEDWTKYEWDVACSKGMQLERGYRVTPTASDVGSYSLSITARRGKSSQTAVATLIISAQSAGDGETKSVIILGDSTTNNGIAVTKLNENFSNDVMNVLTLGTRGTAPNNHEGRSGWRFTSYFAPSSDAGVDNPWYNPTSQTFDAAYYFANTSVAKPDWFFINLGINDTFGYTDDTTLEGQIEYCKSLCDAMISSMKEASPDTKIGVCLTIPPNHSQDAFGKAYSTGQTRDRYKRNNVLWVNSLITEYDNRENEGIYLVPIYTNLDTVYNMGMETIPVNARNTAVTYESPIANGGVHPVESGYWQIADVYTAFLKCYATE